MKKRTSVSIDEFMLEKAQKQRFNICDIANKAIKERVEGVIETDIKIKDKCEFCGVEEDKASRENNYRGLTWLWPDERWICDKCLKVKGSRIPASKA